MVIAGIGGTKAYHLDSIGTISKTVELFRERGLEEHWNTTLILRDDEERWSFVLTDGQVIEPVKD